MERVIELEQKIFKIAKFICTIIMAFMMIMIFIQTILRYVFEIGLIWSEELVRYLFVYTVLFGAPLVVNLKKESRVDLIDNVLSAKWGAIMGIITYAFVSFLLVYGTYSSFVFLKSGLTQTSPSMGLNMGIFYAALPFGMIFMLFFAITNTIKNYLTLKELKNNENDVKKVRITKEDEK